MTNQFTGGRIGRRSLLRGGVAGAAAMAMPRAMFAQSMPTLQWWDVFGTLTDLNQTYWDAFENAGKAHVEYTHTNPATMMQSLQLAFRSGESPDVFNSGGDPATLASLNDAGWFAPMEGLTFDKPFQKETLREGTTIMDGKVVSFPIFTNLWHNVSLWYDSQPMADAGGDPEAGIKSWDEMRKIAQAATKDGKYGLLLPLQFTSRMADSLNDLAMAAGAPGPVDWKTGEYAYASDAYVEALEFLLSFQKDGSLHPASSSVDARQGRSRWAVGEALFFFDGPWNSGVLKGNSPELLDRIGVSGAVTPDGGQPKIGRGAQLGTFYVSGQSKNPDLAVELLQNFTTDDYYVALAERMDQPPLDLSAVERADVHPSYAKIVKNFSSSMVRAPDPLIANPDTAQVFSRMKEVTPGLGEIIQGAFSGSFDDPRPFLQDLSDAMSRERDRAIEAAKGEGFEVSADDWVFDDWTRGEAYGG